MTYKPYRGETTSEAKRLLYDYPSNVKKLRELEDGYILPRRGEPGPAGAGTGDPTGRAAAEMADDAEVAELRRKVWLVEAALDAVRDRHDAYIVGQVREIADHVYFRRDRTLTMQAQAVGKSRRTVLRWNKILLQAVEAAQAARTPLRV